MSILFTNIHQLVGVRSADAPAMTASEMRNVQVIHNAYLYCEEGEIMDYGRMEDMELHHPSEVVDCTDRCIMPGYVDSHTHLVHAASRESEFVMRADGKSYQEIAAAGGGILNSVEKLRNMSRQELYDQAAVHLDRAIRSGTTSIEIKTGYGLDLENELKMLDVIHELKREFDLDVKSTLLAAHAVPREFTGDADGYLKYVLEKILPAAAEKAVDYVDIFVEQNYFTVQHLKDLLKAAKQSSLGAKVHVNQFTALGGVAAAVDHDALSVDHLEVLTDRDVAALQSGTTIPVGLPACSFFLNLEYTPVRRLLDAGVPVALATDFNPGSSPTSNMNFVGSLGVTQMKLTVNEAFNACTIMGAAALGMQDAVGSITEGKKANLILTEPLKQWEALFYHFTENKIAAVYLGGKLYGA